MKRTIVFLFSILMLASTVSCGNAEKLDTSSGDTEPASAITSETPEISQSSASDSEAEPEPEPPPDNDWKFDTPENHGGDGARFAEINQKMAGSQMLAAVIVKDGVVVDEFYQEGYDETSLFRTHSVTKSVSSALIGIALDQGILDGVDVKLVDFFPQLAEPENAGKEKITVEHLLEHTAGLGEGDNQSFRTLMQSENWVDYYLSQPLNYEPGTTFRYSTAGSHMLSVVLEQAADISTEEFAVEYLFNPLGIESYEWGTDPQGVVDGGNGLSLSVRDAAKFGQLYLDNGNWRGKQIISQEWVTESTSVHAKGESDKGQYGYQWWIMPFGGYDVYYALGYSGQFVFVVPELNLVTAIASKSVWSDFTGQVCIREVITAFS